MAATTTSATTATVVTAPFTRMWVRSVSKPVRNTRCLRKANSFSSGTNTTKRRAIPMAAPPRSTSANTTAAAKVRTVTLRLVMTRVSSAGVRSVLRQCDGFGP